MIKKRLRSVLRQEEDAAIELDGRPLPYLLKRSSARRTLALRVQDNGRIWVNAPMATPRQQIELFILRHARWLRERLEQQATELAWGDGMALPYLGRRLHVCLMPLASLPPQLDLFEGSSTGREPEVVFAGDVLLCSVSVADLPRAIVTWYRQQAIQVLDDRLGRLCRQWNIPRPAWHLSDARGRWGSLSPKGRVGLNWRLVKASPDEIDYVICHELAHLRQRNHSPAFWREVARLYPGYEAARARLRLQGRQYFEF